MSNDQLCVTARLINKFVHLICAVSSNWEKIAFNRWKVQDCQILYGVLRYVYMK